VMVAQRADESQEIGGRVGHGGDLPVSLVDVGVGDLTVSIR
jgi:hypothetical protein